MKRSLLSVLFLLGALSACSDAKPGDLKPIPRPEGYVEPPKEEAARPTAEPAADPNKVVLRWKLAEDTPTAFRLQGTPVGADDKGEPAGLRTVYVLQRPKAGDHTVRVVPETRGGAQDQGTFSERGFILDGLGSVDRNLATLLLELPKNPVGVGDTWSLGIDFVDAAPLGVGFAEKKSNRRNTVKLAVLVPEGDERVATIEYDLQESIGGILTATSTVRTGLPPPGHYDHGHDEPGHQHDEKPSGKGKGKGKGEEKAEDQSKGPWNLTSEVSFTGRGEFLVKAGRWRSWEGTLSAKTEGYTPPSQEKDANRVPVGTHKLRLTALDAVPEGLQPAAKK